MGLIESIVKIVQSPKIRVNLHLGSEFTNAFDRKILAKEAREAIVQLRQLS